MTLHLLVQRHVPPLRRVVLRLLNKKMICPTMTLHLLVQRHVPPLRRVVWHRSRKTAGN